MTRCAAALALVCALAGACSGAQLRNLPKDGPQTAADVLAKAHARTQPGSLQGTARLDAYVQGERRSANLLIAIAKPASLQIQALTPTLDLVALFASDGQHFVSFERGGARCHQGRTCPQNLQQFVPIPLPPEPLVAALLGRPPVLAGPQTLHWDDARSLYRVDVAAGSDTQQVFVRPDSFAFAGTVLLRGGQRVLSLAYDGDRQGVPARMRWQEPPRQLDVTVELRDVEVGVAIEPERFAVPCPAGMAVVELPCEATPVPAG